MWLVQGLYFCVVSTMTLLLCGEYNDFTFVWWVQWLYVCVVSTMTLLLSGEYKDCTSVWWVQWLYFCVVSPMTIPLCGEYIDCTSVWWLVSTMTVRVLLCGQQWVQDLFFMWLCKSTHIAWIFAGLKLVSAALSVR